MEHVEELFDGGGALFVDRGAVPAAEEDARFEESLRNLAANPGTTRTMGWFNYERTARGPLSIAARNRSLTAAYEEAAGARTEDALTLGDLPDAAASVALIMTTGEIEAEQAAYRAELGLRELRFDL